MALRPCFSEKTALEQQLGFADFLMRSRHASIVGQLSKDVFAICLQTPRCQWLSPLRLIQIALRGFFVELEVSWVRVCMMSLLKGKLGYQYWVTILTTQACISPRRASDDLFSVR